MKSIKIKSFIKKNSSIILTGFGLIGIVSTSILSAKGAVKAVESKETLEDDSTDIAEKISVYGKCYGPAVISGIATGFCFIAVGALNRKRQLGMISAYNLVSNNFKSYKDKVIEAYGNEAHAQIMKELAVEVVDSNHTIYSTFMMDTFNQVPNNPDAKKYIFYDVYSRKAFESTLESVMAAQYAFNRNYTLSGLEANLYELYSLYGLKDIDDTSSQIGWVGTDYGEYWVEFENKRIVLDNGEAIYEIIMPWEPSLDYIEERNALFW